MVNNKSLLVLMTMLMANQAFALDLPVVPLSVSEYNYGMTNNTKKYTPIKVAKINEPKKAEVVVAQTTQRSYKKQNQVQNQVKRASVQKGSKKFAEQYALELNVTPGVNEIVKIAKGFTNRLVTPFANPRLITSNDLTHKISGNIVYITTNKSNPLGVYITDKDNTDNSISLTLIPKVIPARQINLKIDGLVKKVKVNVETRKWEESRPYVDTLKLMMRELAFNKIPSGYNMEKFSGTMLCTQDGLQLEAKQKMVGSNLDIIVFKATNMTNNHFLINESSCYRPGFLAISTWPKTKLNPSESTELYVIKKHYEESSSSTIRPSVLD
jgi:conjugal transfer pilus assembly protein TraK